MIETLTIIILFYYLVLSVWYTILLVAAFPEVLKKFNEVYYGDINRFLIQHSTVPITIVTPVFNEGRSVLDMIYCIDDSDYKNIRHILVNDGSTDNTIEILKQELLLYEIPNTINQTIKTERIRHCYLSKRFKHLMVIDKDHSPYNTGADSVNAGLNACKTPIIMTVDADTILEPNALTCMLFTMLSRPHCVVTGGSVYVLNDNIVENGQLLTHQFPRHYVTGIQSIEYLRAFLYGRTGLNIFNGALCYPGAFTLFETEALREVNGYDRVNFAYDAEVITKIHHFMRKRNYPHALCQTPNAFGWTDVPNTFKSFWKQRNFWQRGMIRSIFRHFTMFCNPKYGVLGLITFPFYVLFDVFGSVIEFIAFALFVICAILGWVDLKVIAWYLILAWGFIAFITIAIIYLNQISFNKYNNSGDMYKAIALTTAEMVGFRQFRALCCTVGTIHYVINRILGKPV